MLKGLNDESGALTEAVMLCEIQRRETLLELVVLAAGSESSAVLGEMPAPWSAELRKDVLLRSDSDSDCPRSNRAVGFFE